MTSFPQSPALIERHSTLHLASTFLRRDVKHNLALKYFVDSFLNLFRKVGFSVLSWFAGTQSTVLVLMFHILIDFNMI
jgi:hypothetical protein